ncbi:MAG: GGDEF domain-containing protein [Anaerolineales bacterium]|nr:GGDEF domain-containing protein [Anaerolineales bacterium]
MTSEQRHTIGVLVGFHVFEGSYANPFVSPLVRGIQTAARDQGLNVLIGCGIGRGLTGQRLYYPAWPECFQTADFVPVGPWNTDGLLILNPLYFQEQIRYVHDLKEKKFPVLFVGTGAGTPLIMVDNEGGIRQAMEHLVEHGHRSMAFIAGEENDPGDSQIRLKAYRQSVRELGLADDPRLVEYGQHWVDGGYQAVKRMLQSGVKFSAAVCSNDESAMGAIRALREAGLRIPWDVAVTGFDDHLTALAQVPPLTSVHYPLFETGYRAVLLLRKQIEHGTDVIPELTRVSTWLVPRQSCGCLPEVVNAAVLHHGATFDSDRQDLKQFKEDLAQAMMESLLAETTPSTIQDSRPLCDRLVDSFLLSLQDGDLSHFQIALIEILQRIETADDDAHAWQAAISVLRLGAHAFLSDEYGTRREEHAEDLLHQARTLISESARRRYTRMRLQQTYFEEAMGRMTAKLLSSLEEDQVYEILQEQLPQVGIRSGYVAFFEPDGDDPYRNSRLRICPTSTPPLRFATREFPPPGLYPEGEPFSLAVLPLFFQDERLGYVTFDGDNLDPLATVVRQLASVVKSTGLHQTVLELTLTDALTGIHNRRYFEIILQKEAERSQRYDRHLAIIMADIDHFKTYNDTFGHPAGDEALRRVAEGILASARRGLDLATRYGGEEFAIILPETDADGARVVAEAIREKIDSDTGFLRRLTISLGVASQKGAQIRPGKLVDQADRAMYQAKALGRNRTVLFEEWMSDTVHAKGQEA